MLFSCFGNEKTLLSLDATRALQLLLRCICSVTAKAASACMTQIRLHNEVEARHHTSDALWNHDMSTAFTISRLPWNPLKQGGCKASVWMNWHLITSYRQSLCLILVSSWLLPKTMHDYIKRTSYQSASACSRKNYDTLYRWVTRAANIMSHNVGSPGNLSIVGVIVFRL